MHKENEMFLTPHNFAVNGNTRTQAAFIQLVNNKMLKHEFEFGTEKEDYRITSEKKILTRQILGNMFDEEWVAKAEMIRDSVDALTRNIFMSKRMAESGYDQVIPLIASKTIYSLHFEQIPNNNGKFREGIDVDFSCPFYVEMQRVPNYEVTDYYQKFQNMFFNVIYLMESHGSLVLTEAGDFNWI